MKRRLQSALCWLTLVAVLAGGTTVRVSSQGTRASARSEQAWTLDEALAQLEIYPDDAYLQYVALQLAIRQNRLEEIAGRIDSLIARSSGGDARTERSNRVDLFSIFTGALAVQESLQLDTMRVNTRPRRGPQFAPTARTAATSTPTTTPTGAGVGHAGPSVTTVPAQTPQPQRRARQRGRRQQRQPAEQRQPSQTPVLIPPTADDARERAAQQKRSREMVQVASLTGPTVKSHPWQQMLAGRRPEISPLARFVPADFYFVEFRSLGKMLQALETSDLWGTHLFNQAYREARTQNVGERIKRQLALKTEPALRPFYDLVVKEVAVTGSDPFAREGSDVTILFQVKQPEVFKARMDAFLAEAEKEHDGARRSTGNFMGVDYVALVTPDRAVSVYAADPAPDLHVRSNSLSALRRVIESIKGHGENGEPARKLGDEAEFAYMRTLMPRGAPEEDGFVYLSDPFIRRLVGPQLKLTERRRMLCYNHLKMIGHAAMLYRTERGTWPKTLEDLAETNSSPGLFGEGELACPDGGKYSLSEDGTEGVCSRHGRAEFLTPNLEIPVKEVTGIEADEYKAFLEEYNRYWRTYFDPVALRMRITPEQYRLETIVLPLVDNSIYTGLASVLGGRPERLDSLPVPKRNIFSIAARLDKQQYLPELERAERDQTYDQLLRDLGISAGEARRLNLTEFFSRGLGNQLGLHVYDATPTFDLNMASFLGMMVAMTAGRARSLGTDELMIGFAIASLNTPVYLSIPVQDAKIVDRFLERLDTALAILGRHKDRAGWLSVEPDFYKYPLGQDQVYRGFGLRLGPIKLRLFWARIGGGLYVASKPFILEDLASMEAERIRAAGAAPANSTTASALVEDLGPEGHAMVRLRPQNWKEVLPDFRLSWAENDREACLNNLGVLSDVSRALTARAAGGNAPAPVGEELDQLVREYADHLQGEHLFCPEGGRYVVSADGRTVSCSIHGGVLDPRQPAAPTEESTPARLLRELTGATATLTFMQDGLHATVVIDRK